MRRQPEMAELDNTEYVFGENGGLGAPASSFFRRIASMAPQSDDESDNQQRTVGAGYTYADQLPTTKVKRTKSRQEKQKGVQQRGSYFDLDDDWDANVEHNLVAGARFEKSLGGLATESAESLAFAECEEMNNRISRIRRFQNVLDAPIVDLAHLKKLSYTGVPEELRPKTWQLLLGYLAPNAERRERTLAKKRQEYRNGVEQVFSTGLDKQMWHQISIDVPRTNPHIKLYTHPATQKALERILYLWAIRHPASGYVQGISDLVTPFIQTFLQPYVEHGSVDNLDPANLPPQVLADVEADAYWCLTKLLDGIQDNYIHAQPGIHKQVAQLQDLCTRLDRGLVDHLQAEGIEFMQFSFRWMNCLLMREVPMCCTIRIWDTYISEGPQGFSAFHVYVCAAFLNYWKEQIKVKDFQDTMVFLQALPTADWTEKEVELVLSEAFLFQTLYKTGSAHLK